MLTKSDALALVLYERVGLDELDSAARMALNLVFMYVHLYEYLNKYIQEGTKNTLF